MKKTTEYYAKAEAAIADRASDFLEIGDALRDLQDADGEEYNQLVEKAKLGGRKAYYWVSISRAFKGIGAPKDRLRKIGWTKLKELASHVSKENWKDMLQLAEKHTQSDLVRVLAGEESMAGARAVNLRFSNTDYGLLHDALIKHGAIPAGRGLEGKEDAIMQIVKKVMA